MYHTLDFNVILVNHVHNACKLNIYHIRKNNHTPIYDSKTGSFLQSCETPHGHDDLSRLTLLPRGILGSQLAQVTYSMLTLTRKITLAMHASSAAMVRK